jgi:hypothetical protein
MSSYGEFLDLIVSKLPKNELLTSHDLRKTGLVRSNNTLCVWRRKKIGPPYVQISPQKVFYPRKGFISWVGGLYRSSDQLLEDIESEFTSKEEMCGMK